MIIARSPFRVSLLGGGTDYPVWLENHTGAVLGGAIDKYCYVHFRYLPPFFEHKSKIVYSRLEMVKSNDNIVHPAVQKMLQWQAITKGVELYHFSDLPAQRGIGASSAFIVSMLNVFYTLKRWKPDALQLARDASYFAQTVLNENVGYQDQFFSALGGFHHIRFERNTQYINDFNPYYLEPFLMLFDTGTRRIASEVAGEQIKATPSKEGELTEVASLPAKAVVSMLKCDYLEVGELIDRDWQIKKTLTPYITTPKIEELYSIAKKHGAIGGKLLGAGGGGYLLLFAIPTDHENIKKALSDCKYVPFKFEYEGAKVIYNDGI